MPQSGMWSSAPRDLARMLTGAPGVNGKRALQEGDSRFRLHRSESPTGESPDWLPVDAFALALTVRVCPLDLEGHAV